jgi:hypothetical protein
MLATGSTDAGREKLRRDLLRQYIYLQRQLMEAEPSSPAYQGTIRAFRQMGYTLITSGFEEDLDRLLRIRVLEGGRGTPRHPDDRDTLPELLVLESRPIPKEESRSS